jgi:hypothetical protein
MWAARFSETSVTISQLSWHITGDWNNHIFKGCLIISEFICGGMNTKLIVL